MEQLPLNVAYSKHGLPIDSLQTKKDFFQDEFTESPSIPATGQPFDFDPIKLELWESFPLFWNKRWNRIELPFIWHALGTIQLLLAFEESFWVSRSMSTVRNETVAAPDLHFFGNTSNVSRLKQLKLAFPTAFFFRTWTNSHRPTRVTRIQSRK